MASKLREKTQAAVDKLREDVGGCDLAILVDPDTNLVLCKSSGKSVSQDQLDRLADSARLDLEGVLAKALTTDAADGDLLAAYTIEKNTVVAVLNSQGSSDDVLVCQFAKMPNRSDLHTAADLVFNLSTDVEAA